MYFLESVLPKRSLMKDTSYVAATGCWTLKSPGFISLSERGGYRQKVEKQIRDIYAITSAVVVSLISQLT